MEIMLNGKLGEAAEFLMEHLAGTEMSVAETERLAESAGISSTTLARARAALHVKARKSIKGWYISLPGNVREHIAVAAPRAKTERRTPGSCAGWSISSDWTKIAIDEAAPFVIEGVSARLRVKVGMYEFEADEDFPADKLAEILRGLSPHDASAAGVPGLAEAGE